MTELRKQAEAIMQEQAKEFAHLSLEETQQLNHELRVHQIELELQNEELRETQQQLQFSRNRYAELYDFAPVGYLTLNEQGLIAETNLTCATMLGIERKYLLTCPLSNFILREDQDIYYLHRRKIFDTHTPQSCEIRMRKKDGSVFWAHLKCDPVINAEGKFQCVWAAISDVTDRRRMENQLHALLKEKEVLLKEVYHRVKNNFSAVSSLLYLQAENSDDPRLQEALRASRNRINSMALIHERLYQVEDLAEIDFKDVAYELAANLFHSYGSAGKGIVLHVDLEAQQVLLPCATAIPCALILNELVSNALKYAFPEGRHGEIWLGLYERDGQVTLVVRDTGVGFPANVDVHNSPSLGLQVVDMLTEQLRGTLEMEKNSGTTFRLTFPKKCS